MLDARTGVASLINSAAGQDGETPVVRCITVSLPAFMPLPVDLVMVGRLWSLWHT